MNPDSGLNPLDSRFPIRLSAEPSIFWDLIRLRPDRPAAIGEAARAREQAFVERMAERYTVPATQTVPLPELAMLPQGPEPPLWGGEFDSEDYGRRAPFRGSDELD